MMYRTNYFFKILFFSFTVFLFISFITISVPDEALVGHWTFDDEINMALDNSRFESNGVLKGSPRQAMGVIGNGCLELDGKDDYVEILKSGKTPSQFHTLKQGSISIWFKARSIPKDTSISPLFYYGNANGCENMLDASNEGLVIEVAHGKIRKESQGVYFTVFNNPCEQPTFCFDTHSEPHLQDTKGIIKQNEWYHFVAIVGKDYNTGYLNGEEIDFRHYNFSNADASQFFGGALSHDRMWFGKSFWDYGKETYFDGFIDDIRIYNVPLDSKQVKNLYDMRTGN
jgi:hypothetical protein